MLTDLFSESPLSLSAAAKLLPGRPHISTVWRFAQKGVRGVRLETIVSGGRRFTTHEALERFVGRTTAAANGVSAPTPAANTKRRAAEIAAADARCTARGL